MSRFERKVALVTGAGSGIGRAVATRLAADGAKVVATDINLAAAEETVQHIIAAGGVASAFKVDTTKPEDSAAAVAFTVDTYDSLQLAVNNAGVGVAELAPIGEDSLEDWNRVISINLSGVYYGLHAQLPVIAKTGGAVVNIASILGSAGSPGVASYVSAKHAVVGLSKTAALDYAKKGVRVNSVGPGYIETPLIMSGDKLNLDALVSLHPVGRLGQAEEVANLVTFLLSDEASFITGSYHLVDGAYTAP